MWKPNFDKTTRRRGKNLLFSRGYSELSRDILCLQSLFVFSLEGSVYIWWRFSDMIDQAIDFTPRGKSNKEICTQKASYEI